MSLTSTLVAARAAFQRRMRGTCTIYTVGEAVTDPVTGEVTAPQTPIYGPDIAPDYGKCYVRYPGLAFEQNPEVGSSTMTISRIVIRIPFGTVVPVGARVRIESDLDNPQLAGTILRVASIDDQSQATAQRLLAEDFQTRGA